MTLLEKYAPRLNMADRKYKEITGNNLSESKKLVTAVCLENVSRRLTEALDNSVGTQTRDIGAFKK